MTAAELVAVPYNALDGAALAWAVALAEGREPIPQPPAYGVPWRVAVIEAGRLIMWRPHRDWAQLGPLLEQWVKSFGMAQHLQEFRAFAYSTEPLCAIASGPSLPVACCRARVRAVLGESVAIPAFLLEPPR